MRITTKRTNERPVIKCTDVKLAEIVEADGYYWFRCRSGACDSRAEVRNFVNLSTGDYKHFSVTKMFYKLDTELIVTI